MNNNENKGQNMQNNQEQSGNYTQGNGENGGFGAQGGSQGNSQGSGFGGYANAQDGYAQMNGQRNGQNASWGNGFNQGRGQGGFGGYGNTTGGGYGQNPYYNNPLKQAAYGSQGTSPYYNDPSGVNSVSSQNSSLLGSFDTAGFLKGAAIGAIGAYLLTNEKAQKTIFKTIAKATTLVQAGVEEMKERYEDAKAEIEEEENE